MTLGINVIENEKVLEIVGDLKADTIEDIMNQSNRFYKGDILSYHFEKIMQNEIAHRLDVNWMKGMYG